MKKYIAPNMEIIRLEANTVMQDILPNSFSHYSGGANAPARKEGCAVF
jgi:hypothetical protein